MIWAFWAPVCDWILWMLNCLRFQLKCFMTKRAVLKRIGWFNGKHPYILQERTELILSPILLKIFHISLTVTGYNRLHEICRLKDWHRILTSPAILYVCVWLLFETVAVLQIILFKIILFIHIVLLQAKCWDYTLWNCTLAVCISGCNSIVYIKFCICREVWKMVCLYNVCIADFEAEYGTCSESSNMAVLKGIVWL